MNVVVVVVGGGGTVENLVLRGKGGHIRGSDPPRGHIGGFYPADWRIGSPGVGRWMDRGIEGKKIGKSTGRYRGEE